MCIHEGLLSLNRKRRCPIPFEHPDRIPSRRGWHGSTCSFIKLAPALVGFWGRGCGRVFGPEPKNHADSVLGPFWRHGWRCSKGEGCRTYCLRIGHPSLTQGFNISFVKFIPHRLSTLHFLLLHLLASPEFRCISPKSPPPLIVGTLSSSISCGYLHLSSPSRSASLRQMVTTGSYYGCTLVVGLSRLVAYLCFICASPGSTASTHSYKMKYQEYKGLYYNA
jgi:hypothetical protein